MREFRKHALAGAAMAALLSASSAPAAEDGVRFTIKPRVEAGAQTDISIQRWLDFEAGVSLRVRTDPALVPSARVLEMVEAIPMSDAGGLRIVRGYDIDVAHDVVVGWSGGTAEITHIAEDEDGLTVTALLKDEHGRIVQAPLSRIGAYRTGGERLCFEEARVDLPPPPVPMSFVILLDRSGSMASVLEEVKRAALSFVDALPDGATCALGAFHNSFSFRPSDGLGIAPCQAAQFDLSGVAPGGMTDLSSPMIASFHWLHDEARADHQRALIVITDGAANSFTDGMQEAASLKGDVPTFVYHLGKIETRWLSGLADHYLAHEGDLGAQLPRFFEVLSTAYAQQTVMHLRSCPASGHGR